MTQWRLWKARGLAALFVISSSRVLKAVRSLYKPGP
jgi:hypothetical protein